MQAERRHFEGFLNMAVAQIGTPFFALRQIGLHNGYFERFFVALYRIIGQREKRINQRRQGQGEGQKNGAAACAGQ